MTRESKQERAEAALAPTTPQLDGFFVGEMASQREGGNDFKHIKRRASDPCLSLSNLRNLQWKGKICSKCATRILVDKCMVLREENTQLKSQSGKDEVEMTCVHDNITHLKYQCDKDQSEMRSLREENRRLKSQTSEDHAKIEFQHASLKSQGDEDRSKIKDMCKEITGLHRKVGEDQSQMKGLCDEIIELKCQGDQDQAEIIGLHDEITELHTKSDKDQAEIRGLRDEITGHEFQAEFVGLALREENTSLKCKSGELQAELQAAQMAEAAAKDEARDTKYNMERLRERHALQTKTLQPRPN